MANAATDALKVYEQYKIDRKRADEFNLQQKVQKKQRARELEEYDTESGKFFDQMRQGFRERSQAQGAAQQTGALSALNQASARAGTSFSGIQQAAQAQLQGQLGSAQLEAQTGYDQRLNELRQTQRDAFNQGQFDFFHQLQALQYKADLDKDLMRFQADLADQYSSGWNDFFNVIGQGIGILGGNYLGAVGTKLGSR